MQEINEIMQELLDTLNIRKKHNENF
jgi:hypothetical protein